MKEIQGLGIQWKWFQVEGLTASESANMVDAYNHIHKYQDIYDVYKRPSETKVSVWNEWVNWSRYVNNYNDHYEVENLSICANNNQTFTVCAIIREFEEDEIGNYLIGNRIPVATYIMKATRYHNYLYLLASDENGGDVDLCW